MDDDVEFNIPISLKQKLKNSLCFSCCFPHHRPPPPPPPPPPSSDQNPSLIWIKPHDIKDKCRTIFNFIANGNGNGSNRHKRHSSAEFRYDPLSYSLNFEDEADPLTNFSSRLPLSPVTAATAAAAPVKHLGIAAAAAGGS